MKVSVTILKNKESMKKTIEELETTDADYIHVDVMDGKFVPPVVVELHEINELFNDTKKPLDVHLMVENPKDYIDIFKGFDNTKIVTVHAEIDNTEDYIDYIHENNLMSGIAVNPETPISSIESYLKDLDYVLIMGVHPGYGGQKMIPETVDKITELKSLREANDYHYLISLDGGINKETRPLLDGLDVMAVGSFISMSDDFQKSINEIR